MRKKLHYPMFYGCSFQVLYSYRSFRGFREETYDSAEVVGSIVLGQIRSGMTVASFIWFLYLYKRNIFARLMSGKALEKPDRERYLTMDRLSSVALLVLGGMAFAESCGEAVQSVLTVGGIGGVDTAFAAKDSLGNLLSGLAIQFSRPFAEGDYISA